MNTRKLWSRILIIVGGLAMLVGAADPMEGSLVILPGAALVTLGTYLGKSERGLLIEWIWIFIFIAFGVGALWGMGMFGSDSQRSAWWGLLLLPYLIGWVLGITSLLFRLVRTVRHRHAAA